MPNKKALLLISGGIDSPVAGKLAQEKGYELQAVHFSQTPFTDDSPEKKSLALCEKLGLREMLIVEAGEALKEIAESTRREHYFVLMKILMLKTAERIAKEKECEVLITGESIGQVSSQTLSNLNTINNSTKMEIIRPVLFWSKQQIIDRSIKLGFFEVSKGKEMCDVLAVGKPRTISTISEIKEEERKCGMDELVEEVLKKVRVEGVGKEIKQQKPLMVG